MIVAGWYQRPSTQQSTLYIQLKHPCQTVTAIAVTPEVNKLEDIHWLTEVAHVICSGSDIPIENWVTPHLKPSTTCKIAIFVYCHLIYTTPVLHHVWGFLFLFLINHMEISFSVLEILRRGCCSIHNVNPISIEYLLTTLCFCCLTINK